MTDQNKDQKVDQTNIPIMTEPIGFAADELVTCPGCSKPNGPGRQSCIYCGMSLPTTDLRQDRGFTAIRYLEPWEPAVNLVFLKGDAEPAAESISAAAQMLGMADDAITAIVETGLILPLARVAPDQAQNAITALAKLGFQAEPIDDSELSAEHPHMRIRSAEVKEGHFVFKSFNTGEERSIAFDDLILIVSGRIYETRREEVTSRKRGTIKVLDEFDTAGDLRFVDLYSKVDAIGCRVQTNGFDFSVLGTDKEMLAEKNLSKFVSLLTACAPNAVVADEYDDIRSQLDVVWEPEITKDLHGLQMRGYGKREFGATFKSSNLLQFTKYSRMRRLMI